jgi:peroxiredoxin family protein
VNSPLSKVVLFLHSGDYDRVHQGLSIAAAAVATGRTVEIYLFWWALEWFIQDKLDRTSSRRARTWRTASSSAACPP